MPLTRSEAIARARSYLLDQAAAQFSEARHQMVFPKVAGFSAEPEAQSNDTFVRAVLADVLLDIADLSSDDPAFRAELRAIARREADYLAAMKLVDRAGGWSYFPGLPELPPDLDSLAATLNLFTRIAPNHTTLCRDPIDLALTQRRPNGGLSTWLVAPTDSPAQRELMERGVRNYWGDTVDVEVCARFYQALWAYDPDRYADIVHQGTAYVLSQQQSDGGWTATWYWGPTYGTGLCLQLLQTIEPGQAAVTRALNFLAASQRDDGGWGVWQTVPLDTALAIWFLSVTTTIPEQQGLIKRAAERLLDFQTREGWWNASPWIKMDIGRAGGRVLRTATYQSVTLTTAFCLRSLLLA